MFGKSRQGIIFIWAVRGKILQRIVWHDSVRQGFIKSINIIMLWQRENIKTIGAKNLLSLLMKINK